VLPAGVPPAALVDRVLDSFGNPERLPQLLGDLDSEQLESVLDRLEEFEDRFPTDHAEIPVAALHNQRSRLRTERRNVFDIGAAHKVGRVMLRILRRLDPDEVERVTDTALAQIASLSDRGEPVRLVGHREDSGHQLTSETAAARLENLIFDEVLTADAGALGHERDLLSLLLWTQSSRAEQLNARMGELIDADAFFLGLLRAAIREVVGQAVSGGTVRRSAELNWAALRQVVGEERLVARLNDLLSRDLLPLDEQTRLALDLARAHLNTPTDEPERPDGASST
jgi:hypothetical protein